MGTNPKTFINYCVPLLRGTAQTLENGKKDPEFLRVVEEILGDHDPLQSLYLLIALYQKELEDYKALTPANNPD